jgi:probable rRNA maturation factor
MHINDTITDGGGPLSADHRDLLHSAADLILSRAGLNGARIGADLSFVSIQQIRALNRRYRAIDSGTDVLSFPQYASAAEVAAAIEALPAGIPLLLGDVVICRNRALQQAVAFGHSPERELVYLFTHSLLHLLGYDHEVAAARKSMRAEEEAVMAVLKLTRQGGLFRHERK